MKRKRLPIFLLFALLVMASVAFSLSENSVVSASSPAENESDLARESGMSFITSSSVAAMYPAWTNASLGPGQPCFDLKDTIIAYLFLIITDKGAQGSIVVGGAVYDYDVLEAGTDAVPLLPDTSELNNAVQRDLANGAKTVTGVSPRLRYLGYTRLYAEYQTDGVPVSFHLVSRSVEKTADLKTSLTSPEDYKSIKLLDTHKTNASKKSTDLTTIPTENTDDYQPLDWTEEVYLDVPNEKMIGGAPYPNDCGPTSGAMIAEYWKQYYGLQRLPNWQQDHDELYTDMQTNAGWPEGVYPAFDAGIGFQTFANRYGYSFYWDQPNNPFWTDQDYYNCIKTEIDDNRPLMILFYWGDWVNFHWCALRGYGTYDDTQYIIVNDAWTPPVPPTLGRAVNWAANWDETTLITLQPANFYNLSVNTNGNGTVSKSPDLANYVNGVTVTLTANPSLGWSFVSWNGIDTSNGNTGTVTMNANRTVTANFAPIQCTLTVNITGQGSVSKILDQSTYNYGSTVILNPTPAPGWSFGGWSGDLSGSNYPISITMNGDRIVTATFTQIEYTLTTAVSPVNSGSITKNPNQTTYHYGDTVQLTAVPSNGYSFGNWSGDASGTTNPISVAINANKTVTANFNQIEYTLTTIVSPGGNGSITKNPNQTTYHYGDTLQLTAVPSSGYNFGNWSGDASGSTNPISITIDGNKTVTANFAPIQCNLTINIAGQGSVSKIPDQSTYVYGSTVILNPTPATGWSFSGWSGDLSGSNYPISITMNGNKIVTATFTQNTFTLTVNTVGNGTVGRNNNGPYHFDDIVQLTASPAADWSFSGWSGDLSGSTNPNSITMNTDKTVTSTFTYNPPPPPQYTLTTNTIGNGSVTKNPDQSSYTSGTQVQLTAVPATGWIFSGWSGDLTGTTNPGYITINGNKTVTANFVDVTAPVGSLNINSGVIYTTSTAVTLNLQATDGVGVTQYKVVNGTDASGATSVAITSAASYSASVSWTLASGDGSKTVAIMYGDAAGNWSSNYLHNIILDTMAPTVTINQAGGQADPTNSSPINFAVVFSEPVSDFATGDVTIGGTAGATTANVSGNGTTYNVAVSGMTANGTVTTSLVVGVAHDAAGNPNTPSSSTDNIVTYNAPDNIPPSAVNNLTTIYNVLNSCA